MNVTSITVIPTWYSGVLFRSRLEARWAIFFDQLRIDWEYEPEAYRLSDGRSYLPDFRLPKFNGGIFAEVKPDDDDFDKALRFANDTTETIWLCEGPPRAGPHRVAHRHLADEPELLEVVPLPREGRFFWVPAEYEAQAYGEDDLLVSAAAVAKGHRFWEPKR
jgi:hypothetical protein